MITVRMSPLEGLLECGISYISKDYLYSAASPNVGVPLKGFLSHPEAGRLLTQYLMFTQSQAALVTDILEELGHE